MRHFKYAIYLLIFPLFISAQDETVHVDLDMMKGQMSFVTPIDGKGILVAYNSLDRSNFDVEWAFNFYDFGLSKKWEVDGLNKMTAAMQSPYVDLMTVTQQRVNKYKIFRGFASYTLSEDNEFIYLFNHYTNEITQVSMADGNVKKGSVDVSIPKVNNDDAGRIEFDSDGSSFIISTITYPKKSTQSGSFSAKVNVITCSSDMTIEKHSFDLDPIGDVIGNDAYDKMNEVPAGARYWKILGADNKNIALFDNYLDKDKTRAKYSMRLMTIDLATGEKSEIYTPYGDFSKKHLEFYGEVYSGRETNGNVYIVYAADKEKDVKNLFVDVYDYQLNPLSEKEIKGEGNFGDFQRIDVENSFMTGLISSVGNKNTSYDILINGNPKEVSHTESPRSSTYDCDMYSSNHPMNCNEYSSLENDYSGLKEYIGKVTKDKKKPVDISFYVNEKTELFVVLKPTKKASFYEIAKFEKK